MRGVALSAPRRLVARIAVAVLLAGGAVVALPTMAQAHGAAVAPGTRTYLCYTDGRRSGGDLAPANPACKAAIAAGGKQPLWDWFGVLRGDGAGRTRGYIPDGKLCSGGNPKYAAYDLARADWPATRLTAGARWTFRYNAWAPHPGVFTLYVTRDGYDPRKPLRWDDLESAPFSTWKETVANAPGEYRWAVTLPAGKTGRHVIYSVWSRTDSKETFYNCSDVIFDGGTGQVVGAPAGDPDAGQPPKVEQPEPSVAPSAAPAEPDAQPAQPSAAAQPAATDAPATSAAASPKASKKPAPSASRKAGAVAAPSVRADLGGRPDSCRAVVSRVALRGGALVEVTVTGAGATLDPWTVTVDGVPDGTFVAGLSGRVTSRGGVVTATAPNWASGLDAGAQARTGFFVTGAASAPSAEQVRLNGVTCAGPDGDLSAAAAGNDSGGSAGPTAPAVQAVAAAAAGDPTATAPALAVPRTTTRMPLSPGASPRPARPSPPTNAGAGSASTSSPPSGVATLTPLGDATPAGGPSGSCAAAACDGFETQTGATLSGLWRFSAPDCQGTGSATVVTGTAHSGSRSLQVNGGSGYCNHAFATFGAPLSGSTVYARLWVRHTTALPDGHVTFLTFDDASSPGKPLRVGGQNGRLQWNRAKDDATLPEQSPAGVARSVALPTTGWHCLELAVGSAGTARTWVDGVAIAGLTVDGTPTPDIDRQWSAVTWRPSVRSLSLGWESYGGGTDRLWFDDVAVGTSRIGCAV